MILLPANLRARLSANAEAVHRAPGFDPAPVVKFFNPLGAATWLATELDPDGDTVFGLADLGVGCPELGPFSLRELRELRLPLGLGIERDLFFSSDLPISRWAMRRAATARYSAPSSLWRAPTRRSLPTRFRRSIRTAADARRVSPHRTDPALPVRRGRRSQGAKP
jgi:hypothetical protein